MTPSVLNRICARPVVVSWVIGACILDTLLLTLLSNGVRLTSIASDWQGMTFLTLAVVAATGLGFFLGMFTCWPWIRPICSRLNGSPFKVGDHVLILSGPLRGGTADVEDVTVGQGGWHVVWLDLGPERRKTISNIFEEYSLLKIQNGEPDVAADGSQPIRSETKRTSSAAGSRRRPLR
jgi:hypothetical protein